MRHLLGHTSVRNQRKPIEHIYFAYITVVTVNRTIKKERKKCRRFSIRVLSQDKPIPFSESFELSSEDCFSSGRYN